MIFFFKALIIIVGTILTIYFFVVGLRDGKGFKKALLSLLGAFLMVNFLTFFDFIETKTEKKKILIARREASLTGIELILYQNKTFDLGNLRKITKTGTYQIKNDTLVLSIYDTTFTSFKIKSNELLEIKNTGINWLGIELNKLE